MSDSRMNILEQQRKRVEDAVSSLIVDTYKTHLRKIQGDMHTCAVKCCKDIKRNPSMAKVQTCIDDCAIPLINAQNYMQHELGQFQVRLQRCVMDCSTAIDSQIPSDIHGAELIRFHNQFEQCTIKCVDKHIDLIPSMMKSIKTVLAKGPPRKVGL